jgi:hypothetical protein
MAMGGFSSSMSVRYELMVNGVRIVASRPEEARLIPNWQAYTEFMRSLGGKPMCTAADPGGSWPGTQL